MLPSVPANLFVNVIPSVLEAGAANLAMNGVFLDNTGDTSIPLGTVQSFASAAAVDAWYGAESVQALLAGVYFAGYNGATELPAALLIAQYNTAAVAGYLRSAPLTNTPLSALVGLSGTLTTVIDGVSTVSAAINLSGLTSYSQVAAALQTAIQAGSPTSTATVTYDVLRDAFVIISGTTGASSAVLFPTTNSLSTGLLLTSATGALESHGGIAATPAGLMNGITQITQNWATFMAMVDPDAGAAGGPIKQAFATWTSEQNGNYAFIAYDSDPTPSEESSDDACFAQVISALTGTIPIWSATQGPSVGAFVAGLTASLNWNQPGGRTTYAYRSSPSITPDVSNETVYTNLRANGYNAYLNVATRTTGFQWFQPGSISGNWSWIDPYVNQLYWNARFQNDFAELLTQVPDIPYTQAGYNMIRQALAGDIQAMGSFGAWVPGVVLSGSQQVAVNTAAGLPIAQTISNEGWYLQITDPGPSARAARTSPTVTFWYTDGGAVQQIIMASIDIE
jgi:hypothetical protein